MAKEPGKGSTRPALTPDAIVKAATTLIERDGISAFTMRSLGRELGVSSMAVYSHYPSRDDLLAAVFDRFTSTMDTGPVPGERWDNTLRRTTSSFYREEMAHPQLASVTVSSSPETILATHTERIVKLYLAQGMPEVVLTQMWAFVDAYLTGFIANAIEIASMTSSVNNNGTDEAPLWRRVVMGAYTDEAFSDGIEMIIQGVRGLAAPDPCEWRTPEAE